MNDIKVGQGQEALRVMELFAGVGGFRQGLQSIRDAQDRAHFDVVWSNQYEPKCKKQHAAQVYAARWGQAGFVNRDICEVLDDHAAMAEIDALAPDMLVGGFPCQDYSVARPSNQAAGLQGEKGELWWSVCRMLEARRLAGQPVKYLLLENVNRLINSPATCRGRDFAVILASLQSLGYAVEWRVANSGDYGFPQGRERIFIVAYHQSTSIHRELQRVARDSAVENWITNGGVLAHALPAVAKSSVGSFALPLDAVEAQDTYTPIKGCSRFQSSGICVNGQVWTAATKVAPIADFTRFVGQSAPMTLGDVVAATSDVPPEFFIADEQLPRWQYLKGAKALERVDKATGFAYTYSEGRMAFPDRLDKPSRTIIKSEGGTAASRTKHAVRHFDGRLRRLTPEELEELNGFPRGHTAVEGIPDGPRAALMGNALVVGIVRLIGQALIEQINAPVTEVSAE